MISSRAVTGVLASLKVAERLVLYVELLIDGSIKRMGNGEEGTTDTDLFIGVTTPDLFRRAATRLTQDFFRWIGRFVDPSPVGRKCELTIAVKFDDAEEVTSYWEYGTDSSGPPPVISSLVLLLLDITEAWHEDQRRLRDSP